MPLSALSASAAAQRAPLAPLAPPKRLVTPAAPASGLASLASLSELPPLPQQRQPGGARTALPDPKTLPRVLGSAHGDTPHPAAAPAAGPTAAPPVGPSSGTSIRAGKSALKGGSSGQGKPAQPGRRLRWTPGEVQRVVVVARPEAATLTEAKEDYKRNLSAISQLRRQHAHGTPFRELVRALDRAEGGEGLASLPGRGGFPHELEAEAEGASRTWGQIITPPAVAAY